MAASAKTVKTKASVTEFLSSLENETRRADAKAVLKLMKDVTGEKAAMWGPSIVGFGSYKLKSGEWPIIGFSPRKTAIVLYIVPEILEHDPLLEKLGKHKNGKSCLYINKLEDVDQKVLRQLVEKSVAYMRATHS